MTPLNLDGIALTAGGLLGVGPGIAAGTAWMIAVVVVLLLAAIAWWTMKPARRASRAGLRRGRDTTSVSEGRRSTDSHPRANDEISNPERRSRR
jgi:hypothetical protein